MRLMDRIETAFNGEERKNANNTYRDIAEFVMPQQSKYFDERVAKGSDKVSRLFDSTAIQANQDLAAAIQTTLINPSQKWAGGSYENEELNQDKESVVWLQAAMDKLLKALRESNFNTETGKGMLFFTGLGSLIIRQNEIDPKSPEFSGFKFEAVHLAQAAWHEDAQKQVGEIYYKTEMTYAQIIENGWELSNNQLRRAKKNPYESVEVYVCSMKAEDNEDKPYKVKYICKGNGKLLHEQELQYKPEYVSRWQTAPDEVYPRSLSHTALPDIKTLNQLVYEGLQSRSLTNRPVMLVEDDTLLTPLVSRAGSQVVVTNVDGIKPLNTGANIQSQNDSEDRWTNKVLKAFMIDKIMLPDRQEVGEMTAYEVAKRLEQLNKVIGAPLMKLIEEFLQPLILQSFQMMYNKGAFGEPPKAVKDSGSLDIGISFENAFSRSQHYEEVVAVQNFVGMLSQVAQVKPEAMNILDTNSAFADVGEKLGVPRKYLNSPADMKKAEEEQGKINKQGQVLEQGAQIAQIQQMMQQTQGGGQ